MYKLIFTNKDSPVSHFFAISGNGEEPIVNFKEEVKDKVVAFGYPEPALSYILDLPDKMPFSEFIREMKTVDRLLKQRK